MIKYIYANFYLFVSIGSTVITLVGLFVYWSVSGSDMSYFYLLINCFSGQVWEILTHERNEGNFKQIEVNILPNLTRKTVN